MPATISITLDDAALAALRVALASAGTVVVTPVDPKPTDPVIQVIPGFANTRRIVITWGDYGRHYTKDIGGFGQNDLLIVQFTVPADAVPSTRNGSLTGGEWLDNGARRIACLSLVPGDFSGTSLGAGSLSEGMSVGCYFVVGPRNKYVPGVQPGQTVYWNIKQQFPESGGPACNMFVALSKP